MTQDADLAHLFDALDDGSPWDLDEARRTLDAMVELVSVTVEVECVEDGVVAGVPVRTYRPAGAGDLTLVWLHGGGWCTGSLAAVDGLCRDLADRLRATVVSVGYRLAPEHPFPAALEDAVAVARAQSGRTVLGGDSAGGDLAAAAALQVDVAGLVLLSPALDLTLSSPSVAELATGHGLTRDGLERFVALYLDGAGPTDPRASPLLAPDLSGLPPTVLVSAGLDPLRDDASRFAERLLEAGVPVLARCWDGMVHGFHGMAALTPCADEAVQWAVDALSELLRG